MDIIILFMTIIINTISCTNENFQTNRTRCSINNETSLQHSILCENINNHILLNQNSSNQTQQQKSRSFGIFDIIYKKIRNMRKNKYSSNLQSTTIEPDSLGNTTTSVTHSRQMPNKQQLKFIYFGTKWCGAGDVANNKRDIGYFYITDACCREHDLCNDTIATGKTKYDLTNNGRFTRLHCSCDATFFKCLKKANTMVSNQIGMIYFNILGPKCFREEYKIVECKRMVRERCLTFAIDKSSNKTYQWMDNHWY